MKRFASLVVIAALAGTAWSIPAGAVATVDTKVTIDYGDINKVFAREFRGKVKSSKAACEKDRKVKLYEVKPGSDELVSTTQSKASGSWSIGNDIAEGHFYAKVTKALGGGDVCGAARSEKIKVSQT